MAVSWGFRGSGYVMDHGDVPDRFWIRECRIPLAEDRPSAGLAGLGFWLWLPGLLVQAHGVLFRTYWVGPEALGCVTT